MLSWQGQAREWHLQLASTLAQPQRQLLQSVRARLQTQLQAQVQVPVQAQAWQAWVRVRLVPQNHPRRSHRARPPRSWLEWLRVQQASQQQAPA